MIKKVLIAITAVAILIPLLAGCGSLPQSAVAEVNGKVITREDLDRAVEELKLQYGGQGLPEPGTPEYQELQKQVAERLVNEEILWFEAEKMGITVTDEEVNEQLDQFKQQSGGEEQFNEQLKANNITEDRLKDQIRKNLIFQKLYPEVTKDIEPVTDEEALKYYNENQEMFNQPETRSVRHILVKDEALANQVKARLDAGEDFAAVAKEVSEDPGSKDRGGELLGPDGTPGVPTVNSGFIPEFEQAMNSLAVGQISAPVKSQFGFHIIQVTAVNPPGVQSFEEVKETLKQQLEFNVKQREAFEKWFESVKGNYEVIWADEFAPEPTTPATGTETGTTPAGGAESSQSGTQAQPAPAQ